MNHLLPSSIKYISAKGVCYVNQYKESKDAAYRADIFMVGIVAVH